MEAMQAMDDDPKRAESRGAAARRGLRLALWALGVAVAARLVAACTRVFLVLGDGYGDPAFEDRLEDQFALERVQWVITLIVLGACVAGLRHMRRWPDARTGRWATAALVGVVLELATWFVFLGLGLILSWIVVFDPAMSILLGLLHGGAEVAIWTGLALYAASRLRSRERAGAGGLAAVVVVVTLVRVVFEGLILPLLRPSIDAAWLYGVVPAVLTAVGYGVLVALAAPVLRGDAGPDADGHQAAWSRATRGLRLLATGLVARILTVFPGALVMVFVVVPGTDAAQVVIGLVAIAQLIPVVYMAVGAYRLTSLPAPYHSRRKVLAALLCVLVGLVGELYSLLSLLLPIGDGALSAYTFSYFSAAIHLMIPIALLLLLSGAKAIAEHIGRMELAKRAGAQLWLLIGAAVLFALFRSGLADGASVTMLLVFAVTALGLAAMALRFAVASTFRRLATEMSETTAPAAAAASVR